MASTLSNDANTDEKTQSPGIGSSLNLCSQISSTIDSYLSGSLDLKDEIAVQSALTSLRVQMDELHTRISSDISLAVQSPSMSATTGGLSSGNTSLNTFLAPQMTEPSFTRAHTLPKHLEISSQISRELMKEGFVEKRGDKKPLRGWRKRYLQLYSDKTIDYFTDSTLKEKKGTIYLSRSNIKTDTKFQNAIEINYSINFGFNIHTVARKWEFKVGSTTERASWIDALNDCIESKGLTYTTARRATDMGGYGMGGTSVPLGGKKNINFGSFNAGTGNTFSPVVTGRIGGSVGAWGSVQNVQNVHNVQNVGARGGGGVGAAAAGASGGNGGSGGLPGRPRFQTDQSESDVSLFGAGGEYLESLQLQLNAARVKKFSTDDFTVQDLNVPERNFLKIQLNDSHTSDAEIQIAQQNAQNNNNNNIGTAGNITSDSDIINENAAGDNNGQGNDDKNYKQSMAL